MFALLLLFPMHLLMTTTGLTQTFGLTQFRHCHIHYFKKSYKDCTYDWTAQSSHFSQIKTRLLFPNTICSMVSS